MTEFIGGPSAASNLREYPGEALTVSQSVVETPVAESVNPNEADAKLWNDFQKTWRTHEAEVRAIVDRFASGAGAEAVASTVEVEADTAYL